MPVYSEVLENNEILNIVINRYKKILLIGCGACMNESLAFFHNLPLSKKSDDNILEPYPILMELKSIAEMLQKNGMEVAYKYIPEGSNSLCMIDSAKEAFGLSLNFKPDVILLLSCPAGKTE